MPRRDDMHEDRDDVDLSQEPISWVELTGMTQEHERLRDEWEMAKSRAKETKAAYDESYTRLRAAFRRVRKSAEGEAEMIGNRFLANRQEDAD